MLIVSLSERHLDGEMAISIPSVKETAAPLGFTSIAEYDIRVFTRLPCFKTKDMTEQDVVQFAVAKTFREVRDLYDKLKKKYRSSHAFPPFSCDDGEVSERQKTLEKFLAFVGRDAELRTCPVFLQFLGVDPRCPQSIRIDNAAPSIPARDDNSDDEEEIEEENTLKCAELFKKVKLKKAEKEPVPVPAASSGESPEDLFEPPSKPMSPPTEDEEFEDLFVEAQKPAPKELADKAAEELVVMSSPSKRSSGSTSPKARISLFGGDQDEEEAGGGDEELFKPLASADDAMDALFRSTKPSRKMDSASMQGLSIDNLIGKDLDAMLRFEEPNAIFETPKSTDDRRPVADAGPAPPKPVPKPRTKLPPKPTTTTDQAPRSKPPPPPKPRALATKRTSAPADEVDILKYIEDHQNSSAASDIKLFD